MAATSPPTPTGGPCPNCGAAFVGEYCHACGERQLRPEEFRAKAWLAELFHGLTQLDGRISRGVKALLRRPGLLGEAHFRGVRQPYARPLQLFLVVNLVFYVGASLAGIDTFSTQLRAHLQNEMSLHKDAAASWVAEQLGGRTPEQAPAEMELLRERFDPLARNLSKTLVLALAPYFWLLSWLGLRWIPSNKRKLLSEHLVGAMHFVCYFLLIQLVLFAAVILAAYVGRALNRPELGSFLLHDRFLGPALALSLFWYSFRNARRFHGLGRLGSLLTAIGTILACHYVLILYRTMLFHVTVWRLGVE